MTIAGPFCTEEVTPCVSSYQNNGRLYVGLLYYEDGEPLPFTDVTVNLTHEPAAPGEAYIKNHNENTGMLAFILQNRLGKLLPGRGHSGYCTYPKVAFDLERLREFDPAGVDKYLQECPRKKRGRNKTEKGR